MSTYQTDWRLPYRLRQIGILPKLTAQPLQMLIELRAISFEALPSTPPLPRLALTRSQANSKFFR